jgi:hypothetical protein
MRSWIAMLALLGACGFSSSKTGDDDGGVIIVDAGTPDASTKFGTIISVVLATYPTTAVMVESADLDIDTGPTSQSCDPAVGIYCAVAGASFTVAPGLKIRAHGARPLLLVSLTTFDLSGDIDVSSAQDGPPGAGALSLTDCMTVIPPPTLATGASGGFGGSFGGKGGDGDGVNGNRGTATTFTVSWPTPLRGGCPGGNSGNGGLGGNGGGAVAIIADSININGKINASGAGGHGGGAGKTGGGGGGSGGMIVLDVPVSRITRNGAGALFASGGGGGEGGTAGITPAAGQDGGNPAVPMTAAAGGTSDNEGGDGGKGSFGRTLSGASSGMSVGPDGGGGGGGGGAGLIVAPGIMGDGNIAPPTSVAVQ